MRPAPLRKAIRQTGEAGLGLGVGQTSAFTPRWGYLAKFLTFRGKVLVNSKSHHNHKSQGWGLVKICWEANNRKSTFWSINFSSFLTQRENSYSWNRLSVSLTNTLVKLTQICFLLSHFSWLCQKVFLYVRKYACMSDSTFYSPTLSEGRTHWTGDSLKCQPGTILSRRHWAETRKEKTRLSFHK